MHAARQWRRTALAGLALCGALLGLPQAQAHLISAQKGMLNLVGDAAFLVLSVPVSALEGVDDDADGGLSRAELRAHADAVRAQVQSGVRLAGPAGAAPLQLLMLDVAPPDQTPDAAADHLVVMGRFQLAASDAPGQDVASAASGPLTLGITLFGAAAGERQLDVTITRQKEVQWLRFTPEHSAHTLLPGVWQVVADYVQLGATHVLGGADHLMFLLVVLAAGWGWRPLLGALTCFTAGHAATLAVCVWGGWSAPALWVEPAIAATVITMAAYDGWARWHARPARPAMRLALVFACALIHGLGLAGALADLTQWPPGSSQLAWALTGFNLGIEAAQIGVSALAGLVVLGLRGLAGPIAYQRASQFASVAGMAAGSFWLIEHLTQVA